MATQAENKIVCDALAFMRRNIEQQYNDTISQLPRHGKSAATARDDDDEREVLRRIQSIDTLIETYSREVAAAKSNNVIAQPEKPSMMQSRPSVLSARNSVQDFEPYINPFTGQWIIPEHPDNPGPSGTTAEANSSPSSSPEFPLSEERHGTAVISPINAQMVDPEDSRPLTTTESTEMLPEMIPSCDALWEAFGYDPLLAESQPDASNTIEEEQHVIPTLGVNPGSIGSSSERGLNPNSLVPSEVPLTEDDMQDIERALREFEDQLELRGWGRPKEPQPQQIDKGETFSQGQDMSEAVVVMRGITAGEETLFDRDNHIPIVEKTVGATEIDRFPEAGPSKMPSLHSIPVPQSRQDSVDLDLDGHLALFLAQEFEQNIDPFQRQSWREQDKQELQLLQDELNRRDEEEMQASLAYARQLQEAWDHEAAELLAREQEDARRIAEEADAREEASSLDEVRRLSEMFQQEEQRRFEEDARLARQLAEMDSQFLETEQGHRWEEQYMPPASAPMDPPPYTEMQWEQGDTGNGRGGARATPTEQAARLNPFRGPRNNPPASSQLNSQSFASASTPAFPARPTGATAYPAASSVPSLQSQNDRQSRGRPHRSSRATGPRPPRQHPGRIQSAAPSPISLAASDQDAISASLDAALAQQETWQQEIRTNEAAARAIQDEIKRQEDQAREERLRLQREQEDRRRAEVKRQEEEHRARLAREADCSVCAESIAKDQMCQLKCKHYYCRGCLARTISVAVKDKKVFRCCKTAVDAGTIGPWVPGTLTTSYAALVEELGTPNPIYCSARHCSTFIAPAHYFGSDGAVCPRCGSQTCRLCKAPFHPGVICKQDVAGQALLALGNKKKWTQCPHCRNMVERRSGCLHMSCRCGTSFCYNCGRQNCGGEDCRRR